MYYSFAWRSFIPVSKYRYNFAKVSCLALSAEERRLRYPVGIRADKTLNILIRQLFFCVKILTKLCYAI